MTNQRPGVAASDADRTVGGDDRARPIRVSRAVSLLWISIAFGAIALAIDLRTYVLSAIEWAPSLLVLGIKGWSVRFIAIGSTAARLLLLVVVLLGLPRLVVVAPQTLSYPDASLLLTLVSMAFQVSALYLLFTGTSHTWFRAAQREAVAHRTATEGALSQGATITAYLLASLSSAIVWFGIALATGQNEAWDSSFYFVAGLPALAVFALVLGYAYPERPWRWAVAAGGAQVVSAFVMHPATGPLIVIGIMLFALITCGLVLVAHAGAGLSHWKHEGHAG